MGAIKSETPRRGGRRKEKGLKRQMESHDWLRGWRRKEKKKKQREWISTDTEIDEAQREYTAHQMQPAGAHSTSQVSGKKKTSEKRKDEDDPDSTPWLRRKGAAARVPRSHRMIDDSDDHRHSSSLEMPRRRRPEDGLPLPPAKVSERERHGGNPPLPRFIGPIPTGLISTIWARPIKSCSTPAAVVPTSAGPARPSNYCFRPAVHDPVRADMHIAFSGPPDFGHQF